MRLFGFGTKQQPENCAESAEPEYLPYEPMYPDRAVENLSTSQSEEGDERSPSEAIYLEVPQLVIRTSVSRHRTLPWYKKAWKMATRHFNAGKET
jgi:hypothetical protein